MSHGFAGGIYGSDGQPMSIDEAEDYFNSQRCPGLIEKPKVFLISACQTNPGMSAYLFDILEAVLLKQYLIVLHKLLYDYSKRL